MATPAKRPAHRPSRRGVVVEAAMHLLAVRPVDEVTVADIADEAGMTPAAVYYHYPSKDDLLLDGLRQFAAEFTEAFAAEALERARTDGDLGGAITDMLVWADDHRYPAMVWFVTSPGLSISVETLRRETRASLVTMLAKELRRTRPAISAVDAGAAAVGLVALLEQALVSWLTEDTVLAQLGRRRFATEVHELSALIVGG